MNTSTGMAVGIATGVAISNANNNKYENACISKKEESRGSGLFPKVNYQIISNCAPTEGQVIGHKIETGGIGTVLIMVGLFIAIIIWGASRM